MPFRQDVGKLSTARAWAMYDADSSTVQSRCHLNAPIFAIGIRPAMPESPVGAHVESICPHACMGQRTPTVPDSSYSSHDSTQQIAPQALQLKQSQKVLAYRKIDAKLSDKRSANCVRTPFCLLSMPLGIRSVVHVHVLTVGFVLLSVLFLKECQKATRCRGFTKGLRRPV